MIIFIWLYSIFEGLTEAFTWDRKVSESKYHIWRIGENIGIIGALLWIRSHQIPLYILGIYFLSGLSLYEMTYSWQKYKNPLYNKTSKWLGISHPKGWVWLVIFILSLIGIIKL